MVTNAKSKQSANESSCRHIWLIEPANGPRSRGTCKLCGMEKDFSNAPVESYLRAPQNKVDD